MRKPLLPHIPGVAVILSAFLALTLPARAQPPSHPYAQLSPKERMLTDYVDTHLNASIQLLTDAVNINSGTLNIAGVKKVGALFAHELQLLGFTIEWVSEPDSLHRAGHLVAIHHGKKGKRLFLIGHLDTVFEPDMPAGPYTRLNDSTATGQGVNDMKGGDVVVIAALRALAATKQLQDMNIIVYFTGDEENAGYPHAVARQDFIERAKTCDIALAFEGAKGLDTVAAARRGASSWTLDVTAKTGHSAGVFSDSSGDGAIYEAARILNSFREQLGHEQFLTFNPGIIIGGSSIEVNPDGARGTTVGKSNIISPAAHVTGDLRFIRESQKDSARDKMRAIVAASLPGTHSTIHFSDGLPSMPPTAGNMRLVDAVSKVTTDLGLGPSVSGDPGARGAGDISDIAQYLDWSGWIGSLRNGGP